MSSLRRTCSGLLGAVFLAASVGAGAEDEGVASVLHCPLESGRSSFEVPIGGRNRHVQVEVGPQAGKNGPAPVVFLWHGWGGDPRSVLAYLDLKKAWPEAVAIAPRGLPRRFPGLGVRSHPGWQIAPAEFDDRDVRLFDSLVHDLSKLECLDASRFVSSGFSNGGYFSNLLGCERPSVLAAIAPVGGGGPPGDCEAPMAVWIAHGTGDRVIPVREGRATFAAWRESNTCEEGETSRGGCSEAKACRRETVLCTFKGGHWWPRDLTPRWVRFLRDQRRPGPKQP